MKITRRAVLRLTGAAAASLALSSCSASGSAILGSNFSSWLQQTLGISSSGAASSAAFSLAASEALASASASFELSLQRDLTLVGGKRADSRKSDDDRNRGRDDSIDVPIPIAPPQWMSSAKCIASTMTPLGRCWVIKGRDAQRGEAVLMKVLPLPPTIGALQRTRILDLCETTSSVTHPHWVAPRIAAIRQGYLAVVRPWIFGTSLTQYQSQHQSASETDFDCLAPLVQLGITLSAAHRGGVTHGLISANNVIVNHQASIQLVDAASSVGGWASCLMHWSDDLQKHLPWRIENDVRGYQQLVIETCLRFMPQNLRAARSKLIQRVIDVPDATDPDTCIAIAEDLQRTIDQPTSTRPWWRK